jgi:hypothetical protein
MGSTTHPLGTRFPGGMGFIEAVPSLIEDLPGKLKLRPKTLDGSVDGLSKVDRAVHRVGGQRCLDDPDMMAALVAYVGEVIRNVTGGDWAIDAERKHWEPVVAGPDGQRYATFGIFKEVLEHKAMEAHVAVRTRCNMPGFVRRRSGLFAASEQASKRARGVLATVPPEMYRVVKRYGDGAPWVVQFEEDIELDGFPFAANTDAAFKRSGDFFARVLSRPTRFENFTFVAGTTVTFHSSQRDGRLGDMIRLGADQDLSGVPCKAGTLTQLRLHRKQTYLAAGTLSREHAFGGIAYPADTWFSVDIEGRLIDHRVPGWDRR